jgi:hypothetical protein
VLVPAVQLVTCQVSGEQQQHDASTSHHGNTTCTCNRAALTFLPELPLQCAAYTARAAKGCKQLLDIGAEVSWQRLQQVLVRAWHKKHLVDEGSNSWVQGTLQLTPMLLRNLQYPAMSDLETSILQAVVAPTLGSYWVLA